VLDWEFACAGSRLIDFATFLRGEDSRPARTANSFADAYRSTAGTLPDGWRRLTRLVDLLNLAQMLEWSDEHATDDLRRLAEETLGAIQAPRSAGGAVRGGLESGRVRGRGARRRPGHGGQ
jgi:aminoglycoside phosphotransferase (APT) family kinase protein